jgi:NAD(P)-dependent dehydrogenase (short-subunit alcohol dehydrogenase family)
MRAVHAQAPVEVPMPFAEQPQRHTGLRIFGSAGHPVARALCDVRGEPATATLVLLGARFAPADNALLLAGMRNAWLHHRRLVLIHLGAGGGTLLRSSMADRRIPEWLSIELPAVPSAAALHAALRLACSDGTGELRVGELRVGGTGTFARSWRPFTLPPPWQGQPGPRDPKVAVVTGGLGGLGLRVAALLSYQYGLHPVLIDKEQRLRPGSPTDRRITRLASYPAGLTVRAADVTDAHAMAAALSGLSGPITTVVHCAGVLGPPGDCSPDDLAATQAVKVIGLRNVLAAVDPRQLSHLITFGSILAEQPAHNLGCYALANELLRRATLEAAARVPHATTVVAEWSIWAGAGMAHNLGLVAQARRRGLVPISVQAGIRTMSQLMSLPAGAGRAQTVILKGSEQ